MKFIRKELNQLDLLAEGSILSAEGVYSEYSDQHRDDWRTKIFSAPRKGHRS